VGDVMVCLFDIKEVYDQMNRQIDGTSKNEMPSTMGLGVT
jgi:hypothetical protein